MQVIIDIIAEKMANDYINFNRNKDVPSFEVFFCNRASQCFSWKKEIFLPMCCSQKEKFPLLSTSSIQSENNSFRTEIASCIFIFGFVSAINSIKACFRLVHLLEG
jgi:hypothetical protein